MLHADPAWQVPDPASLGWTQLCDTISIQHTQRRFLTPWLTWTIWSNQWLIPSAPKRHFLMVRATTSPTPVWWSSNSVLLLWVTV